MQKLLSAMPLLAACWVPPCNAYETDLHYGMTFWLSRTAGLDDAESRHGCSPVRGDPLRRR